MKELFTSSPHQFHRQSSEGKALVVQWIVHGAGKWNVTINHQTCSLKEGYDPAADLVVVVEAKDFVELATGNQQEGWMQRRFALLRDINASFRLPLF